MRYLSFFVASALLAISPRDQQALDEAVNGWWSASMKTHEQRIAWWREARFGCFIHWGVYSGPAGEWNGKPFKGYAEHLMRIQRIPLEVYKREVVAKFNPEKFNAEEWVRIIKGAGMRYVIITAKHHDGFAMWPSKVSKYNIHDATPFQRDPMKELADACRRNGIRFGFYYSHAFDWEDPDAPGNDWDYDNPGGDRKLHGDVAWYDLHPDLLAKARRYVDRKAIPQVLELVRMYQPDIMWFDTPQKLPLSEQLRIMKALREAAPNVVINGRCARGGDRNFGDYQNTGDRAAEFPPTAGDWESIPTTNESYGYHKFDDSHKTPEYFSRLIAKAAARGGNILLNIGPMGNGEIDPKDQRILAGIGRWMAANGAGIYGSSRTPLPVQVWGESTLRGNRLFLQVFDPPTGGNLIVGGLMSNPARGSSPYSRLNDRDLSVQSPGPGLTVALQFDEPISVDPARLLSSAQPNVLRAFDAALHGPGLKYGDGKAARAYVQNWTGSDQWLSWKVRVSQASSFTVEVRTSADCATCAGAFRLAAGDIDAERNRLVLPAGEHQITLKVDRIAASEMPRVLDVTLRP